MSAIDALLGRVQSDGVELELGGGLNFKEGITARRNSSTRMIDVSYIGGGVTEDGAFHIVLDSTDLWVTSSSGHDAQGLPIKNVRNARGTRDLQGTGSSYITLLSVPLTDVLDAWYQRNVVGVRVEIEDVGGGNPHTDDLVFAVQKNIAQVRVWEMPGGTPSAYSSAASIYITGPDSGYTYSIVANATGSNVLLIRLQQHASIDRYAQATCWFDAPRDWT